MNKLCSFNILYIHYSGYPVPVLNRISYPVRSEEIHVKRYETFTLQQGFSLTLKSNDCSIMFITKNATDCIIELLNDYEQSFSY